MRSGAITCTITGPRRRTADLPQGGMEMPFALAFSGDSGDLLFTCPPFSHTSQ